MHVVVLMSCDVGVGAAVARLWPLRLRICEYFYKLIVHKSHTHKLLRSAAERARVPASGQAPPHL